MATCWITEFSHMAISATGPLVQAPKLPPVAKQNFTFTTATLSSAFSPTTTFVRVVVDSDAHMLSSSENFAATTADMPIFADSGEYFGVTPGGKISLIVAA